MQYLNLLIYFLFELFQFFFAIFILNMQLTYHGFLGPIIGIVFMGFLCWKRYYQLANAFLGICLVLGIIVDVYTLQNKGKIKELQEQQEKQHY